MENGWRGRGQGQGPGGAGLQGQMGSSGFPTPSWRYLWKIHLSRVSQTASWTLGTGNSLGSCPCTVTPPCTHVRQQNLWTTGAGFCSFVHHCSQDFLQRLEFFITRKTMEVVLLPSLVSRFITWDTSGGCSGESRNCAPHWKVLH